MKLLLVTMRLCQCVFIMLTLKKNIKEVFLEFFDVGKINGGVIAKEMLNFLVSKELPLTDCTGQCYDDFDRQLEKKGVV